jgi:hypothetical protein
MDTWAKLAAPALCATLSACQPAGERDARTPHEVVRDATRAELAPFSSETELRRFLSELARATKRGRSSAQGTCAQGVCEEAAPAKLSCAPESCESLGVACGVHPDGCGGSVSCGPCDPTAEPSAAAAEAPSESVAPDSVTNVQHAGVDEGGIVKLRGDHLIVLRRGRLYSISLANGGLEPVSSIDAFGPEIDPTGTWYDELLVASDKLVVIGYSYQRGGTEIGLFGIDPAGRLSYRATYQLRSNDYYSARNYASRLIDDRLVFYTPLALNVASDDLYASFPALRKWRRAARDRDFRRTLMASRVYRPLVASPSLTLHTLTSCDLGQRELVCSSTAVLGPPSRVFYVSPRSVSVWVSDPDDDSILYRMPLDGSAPLALRAMGAGAGPVDQLSFLESDEHLNVLVRADSAGDGMWSSEHTAGDVALLRVPLAAFSRRARRAPASSTTRLPRPDGPSLQNRFVADHLLYGTGSGWGAPRAGRRGTVFVHRLPAGARGAAAEGGKTSRLRLGHGADRIEALGSDAIVIGNDGRNLHFSPIALGAEPRVAARATRTNAAQGELRSHGFFYRPDGDRSGLFGLPIRESARPGYEHLIHGSASVLFFQNRQLALTELGSLAAEPARAADDGCRASCVDWYGNARPLFVSGRIFALLGYEIVEGEQRRGRLREKRRTSFAPRARR